MKQEIDSEEKLIMLFFTGRVFELIDTYYKKCPNDVLTYKDFLYIKNKAWNESKTIFNIIEKES